MWKNHLKIAWRNLIRNKGYSLINIGGLAAGMAVAILIGLWLHDEISYNKYHSNYDHIAQVVRNETYNGQKSTSEAIPFPLGNELSTFYGSDFKHVVMASWVDRSMISSDEKSLMISGAYMDSGAPEMLSLRMIKGEHTGLGDPTSILISESVAKMFFGNHDPIDKMLKLANRLDVKVTGVYEDIPLNTEFGATSFIAPWDLYAGSNEWIQKDSWTQNGFRTFVQISGHADMADVSAKIKDVKLNRVSAEDAKYKPEIVLFPMSRWHLYSTFENGVSVGGRIQTVWLFGVIGVFVLLLACINFMNLATARSEKRGKEVGIRKSVGSRRGQLIRQFFTESIVTVLLSLMVSLVIVQLLLPYFNQVADKQVFIPWANPLFWLMSLGFSLLTGLVAGSYPALYLSSFQPIQVLKGTFKVGRFAAVPRKVLVVVQFTVSVTLIIGVMIVFRQIEFGKDRAVGYNREGLIMVETPTAEIHNSIDAFREELIKGGMVVEVAESLNPITGVSFTMNGYNWSGKDPGYDPIFATVYVSHEFGSTVGWKFAEGRDFSRAFSTDSSGMVLNQAAVKAMGLQEPIGETVIFTFGESTQSYKIIGIIQDMLMESPYAPVKPSIYVINPGKGNIVNIKMRPNVNSREALTKIGSVFKKYAPSSPFEYKFVDEEYERKFRNEERIGKMVGFFSLLATLISCLGIFGLSSFMAEQRTKEIGIRKVLGASVANLWHMLSKEFVLLVMISCVIAIPLSLSFMSNWLRQYEYHTTMPWYVFGVSGFGCLILTLVTISYQAIKAAMTNPVESLRNE